MSLVIVLLILSKLVGHDYVLAQIQHVTWFYELTFWFLTDSPDENEKHWGAVNRYFSTSKTTTNVFVLDFTKPRASLDPAYPVVKQMLTKSGYLSQFVNFNTYSHDQPRDQKRSNIILQGVARQILQKAGVRYVGWIHSSSQQNAHFLTHLSVCPWH